MRPIRGPGDRDGKRLSRGTALLLWALLLFCPVAGLDSADAAGRKEPAGGSSAYPWHRGIVSTVFWIGTDWAPQSPSGNLRSSWDAHWVRHYGGEDSPVARAGLLPGTHAATLNPFYVALPFNDLAHPGLARKWIPWDGSEAADGRSRCEGHWVEIEGASGKRVYAQWMDAGPFVSDDAAYVFGAHRPRASAGIDVSPAVKEYLGLGGRDRVNWRFVERRDVPPGPWITYLEEAILYQAIKEKDGGAGRAEGSSSEPSRRKKGQRTGSR
ncbi:hypothetical protein [Methylacidimicrobium sp. B4]|uniref:hypothetical protein n=1 Tax=Methylacidimicrobium sp. B4 TaxID=2796139 RepID=UPI001F5DC150|nr:hypothetical protein [Methylacidimicrobium sp. B4]